MKNFKKLLILTAVISSMAFGENTPVTTGTINNPGDSIASVDAANKSAQAGVPMEVRVNVIGQGPQLVLVDETGTLIENLTFDHGNKLLATGKINGAGAEDDTYIPQESKVEKIVILKRTDGKAFNAGNDSAPGGVDTYTGNFIAISNNPDDHTTDGTLDFTKKTHQMTLTRLTATETTEEPAHTMKTALDYESQDMSVVGTRNEIRTTIVSTIPQRTIAKPGLYIGTGTFIGRLTVATLKPAPGV